MINTIVYNSELKKDLPDLILSNLKSEGYVLIKDYPLNINNPQQTILEISSKVGIPISHDHNNSIVWDIKLNDYSISSVKTFSEHNHEATLHTDSQYSLYPEDYFSLLCLKKAKCGGGVSYILTLKDILDDLIKLPMGKKCIEVLSKEKFPFVIPSVFSKEKSNDFEFNYGYILQNNEIRFRIDIIEKALELEQNTQNNEKIWAYELLKNSILTSNKTLSFQLEDNDLIFINNKTTLHGRSSFEDRKRHLLRVRMNKLNLS